MVIFDPEGEAVEEAFSPLDRGNSLINLGVVHIWGWFEVLDMRLLITAVSIGLTLLMVGCESVDSQDQRHLRRHFNLPKTTVLVQYKGYPAAAGLGQREGLRIQAVYQLTAEQAADIVNNGADKGWRKLPIPEKTRAKLLINDAKGTSQINIPYNAENGYFLCKTVGSNVLYASNRETHLCENFEGTYHCSEPVPLEEAKNSDKCRLRFSDQILGVLDVSDNRLHTYIGSGY